MFSSKNKGVSLGKLQEKPLIIVSGLVREACSVYMEKGRFHSTASKLSMTKTKCMRIGREL
jgi:hypothetical protein